MRLQLVSLPKHRCLFKKASLYLAIFNTGRQRLINVAPLLIDLELLCHADSWRISNAPHETLGIGYSFEQTKTRPVFEFGLLRPITLPKNDMTYRLISIICLKITISRLDPLSFPFLGRNPIPFLHTYPPQTM